MRSQEEGTEPRRAAHEDQPSQDSYRGSPRECESEEYMDKRRDSAGAFTEYINDRT